MKRVLLTGMTSLHGWPLYNALTTPLSPQQVRGLYPPQTRLARLSAGNVLPCCMHDSAGLREAFAHFRPTHGIPAAGMCDLNVCALWPGLAYQRNVEGARNVAQLSRDCHVLFCRTDLIFSGNTPPEAGYDEASQPDPLSMMGKTVCQAEQVMGPVACGVNPAQGFAHGRVVERS